MIERNQQRTEATSGVSPAPVKLSALAAVSMRGDLVTIGPVLPEDTGAIFVWLNDVASVSQDFPYRPVDWMSYNAWLENFSKGASQVLFAIRRVHEPIIIGFAAFVKIDSVHRSAEFSIRIGSEYDRGKGYGKDAIRLALAYAWKHLNLNRVYLSVLGFNCRAIGAYEATGFQCEGKLRQATFINGSWTDVALMAVLHPRNG